MHGYDGRYAGGGQVTREGGLDRIASLRFELPAIARALARREDHQARRSLELGNAFGKLASFEDRRVPDLVLEDHRGHAAAAPKHAVADEVDHVEAITQGVDQRIEGHGRFGPSEDLDGLEYTFEYALDRADLGLEVDGRELHARERVGVGRRDHEQRRELGPGS